MQDINFINENLKLMSKMVSLHNLRRVKYSPALFSVFVMGALLISICLVTPYWMTNDDVGMSMRSHGYGSFDYGGGNLIFSNVLWGYVVNVFPSVLGLLGYSLATYAVLSLVAGFCCWFLIRLGFESFSAVALIFFSLFFSFVSPQFTITSGLAAVTAVLAMKCYVNLRKFHYLIFFVVWSVLSFLIRWNEFIFIFLISIPLLINFSLLKDRIFWIAVFVLTGLLSGATVLNKNAYDGDEWRYFKEFNDARIEFSDYGMSRKLLGTESARRLGYSDNDLLLLEKWFFVDKNISAPHLLNELKNSVVIEKPKNQLRKIFQSGAESYANIFKENTVSWMAFLILILSFFLRSWRMVFALSTFSLLLFYTGSIGRPAPVRVFFPALVLLLFFALYFAFCRLNKVLQKRFLTVVMIFFCVYGFSVVVEKQNEKDELAKLYRQNFFDISDQMLVTWGAGFPYEYVYMPLDRSAYLKKIDFYGIGATNFAPTSKAYRFEAGDDTGFVNKFLSEDGVRFSGSLGREFAENLLSVYCSERHAGVLGMSRVSVGRTLGVVNVKCKAS